MAGDGKLQEREVVVSPQFLAELDRIKAFEKPEERIGELVRLIATIDTQGAMLDKKRALVKNALVADVQGINENEALSTSKRLAAILSYPLKFLKAKNNPAGAQALRKLLATKFGWKAVHGKIKSERKVSVTTTYVIDPSLRDMIHDSGPEFELAVAKFLGITAQVTTGKPSKRMSAGWRRRHRTK